MQKLLCFILICNSIFLCASQTQRVRFQEPFPIYTKPDRSDLEAFEIQQERDQIARLRIMQENKNKTAILQEKRSASLAKNQLGQSKKLRDPISQAVWQQRQDRTTIPVDKKNHIDCKKIIAYGLLASIFTSSLIITYKIQGLETFK
jgi:hypothetical protein